MPISPSLLHLGKRPETIPQLDGGESAVFGLTRQNHPRDNGFVSPTFLLFTRSRIYTFSPLHVHQLKLQADLHLVADDHSSGLERLIPVEPVVLAVDLRRRAEARALAAPRILAASFFHDVQHDV